jgi:hypothetical protein
MDILYELNNQRIDKFIVETIKNNSLKEGKLMSLENDSLEFIREINKLGFFTYDSQDGIYEKSEDSKYKERCYISGFIHIDKLNKILDLFKDKDFDIMVHNIIKSKEFFPEKEGHELLLTMWKMKDETFWNTQTSITENMTSVMLDKILKEYNTPSNYFGGGVEGLNLPKNKWKFITLYDKRFKIKGTSEDGLFNFVINLLQSID